MIKEHDPALLMSDNEPSGYSQVAITRLVKRKLQPGMDNVADEVPVALVFNGISYVVMLASPLNLIDFAVGFSFSEGIISQRAEIHDIETVIHPELGIELHITIASACFMQLKQRRRNLAGRTGCGLCGLESLAAFAAGIQIDARVASTLKISQQTLFAGFNQLQQQQRVNLITGAMHAAALINPLGEIILLREDLGRHNALDKLIGAMLSTGLTEAACVIMTSRASYELVQKSARAGIAVLATISAPTSLAIRHASQSGLTLTGFVRQNSLVVYSHPERIYCVEE